jgi:hypothetical protein
MTEQLIRKIYRLLLKYINSEVSSRAVGIRNPDYEAQGKGDLGRIAIRTGLSIDKLVKEGVEYAYLESEFETQTQNPTRTTPEIGRLLVSKDGQRYSISIARKDTTMPYMINVSRQV